MVRTASSTWRLWEVTPSWEQLLFTARESEVGRLMTPKITRGREARKEKWNIKSVGLWERQTGSERSGTAGGEKLETPRQMVSRAAWETGPRTEIS